MPLTQSKVLELYRTSGPGLPPLTAECQRCYAHISFQALRSHIKAVHGTEELLKLIGESEHAD